MTRFPSRVADKCSRGRTLKCPESSTGGLEWRPKVVTQQRRRKDRSTTLESTSKAQERMVLTNTRIPSASPFQLSTILLSSSSALSRYIENKGSEPSEKLDSPSGAWFCTAGLGGYWKLPMNGICEGGVWRTNYCLYLQSAPSHRYQQVGDHFVETSEKVMLNGSEDEGLEMPREVISRMI